MSDGTDELQLARLLVKISEIKRSPVFLSADTKEWNDRALTAAEAAAKQRYRAFSQDAATIQMRMSAGENAVANETASLRAASMAASLAELAKDRKRPREKLQGEDDDLAPADKLANNKACAAAIKQNNERHANLCDARDEVQNIIDGADNPDAEESKLKPVTDLLDAGIAKCLKLDHEMVLVLQYTNAKDGWDFLQHYRQNPVARDETDAKAISKAKAAAKEAKPLKKAPAGGGGGRFGGGGGRGGGRARGGHSQYSYAPSQPAFSQPSFVPPQPAQPAGSVMSGVSRVGPCHICQQMGHLQAHCPSRPR